jgi:hypothetical protein
MIFATEKVGVANGDGGEARWNAFRSVSEEKSIHSGLDTGARTVAWLKVPETVYQVDRAVCFII